MSTEETELSRAAALLTRHLATGHLTIEEYDQRLARLYHVGPDAALDDLPPLA